jgi:adenylate cyclase
MERAHLKRRLTAVLIADVAGYSRLMSVDEEDTHIRLAGYLKDLLEPRIAANGGRLIRSAGDGFLAEFDSAVDAVRCGLEIQREMAERNATVPAEGRIQFRIGINAGDVIVEDKDIYGNSVNIAARLEGLAEPGGVCVTRHVREQLLGQPNLVFEDRGDRRVKNIARPIRVYRVKQRQQLPAPHGLIARARQMVETRAVRHWRSAVASAAALAAIAAVTIAALPLGRDFAVTSAPASIIVLPFRNASGNPDEDYVADAITEDLTTDLSRLAYTAVIAPATAFTFKDKTPDPREIGRELGVRYLLQGSIRKSGLKLQTNAQLSETRSLHQIWADRFDNELGNLAELQDAVTGRIASSLHIELIKAENRRALAQRPTDPDATDLRLRAMALIMSSITPEHSLAARRHLEQSVRLDPRSADSWSHLALLLVGYDYLNHWNEAKDSQEAARELLRRGEAALQEAMKIDPSNAVAHFADGFIRRAKGDHEGALDAFDRAVQLNPNFASAWVQKANQLVMVGRPKEAPALVLKAIALSPRDPAIGAFYWVVGRAYFVMKNYDDAIIWLRKSVEVRPNLWYNRAYLIAAYALTNRHQQSEGVAALNNYNAAFAGYNVERIRNLYAKELPHPDPGMQASISELYRGLQMAGVPER